jgi:DNA-binding transcriptional regulator YdaS (Cro superfamily)
MKLHEWLANRKMSNAEFARISGIGQRALVQKYRRGRQFPAPGNLRRIRTATNGEVTADDFVDQDAEPLPPVERPVAKSAALRDPVINEAIAIAGGPTALTRMLGIKVPAIYSWKKVPPRRVLAIERVTGIPRTKLRPDLYPPEEKPHPDSFRPAA